MKHLDKFIVRLRLTLTQPINTSAVIIMALYTFMWGCFVANPFWHVFETAPLYSVLMSIFPEYVWGLIAMVCGGFMIVGVVQQRFNSLSRGAFIGFIHWGVIATCYTLGDWQNTGGITAAMVAVYCGFIYLNLRINKDNFPFHTERNPVDQ